MDKKTILITAGETSGDIHAANLIRNLKKIYPGVRFVGIGGNRMEEEGVELLERMERLSIIGIAEIFPKLGLIIRTYKKIIRRAQKEKPDLVILVDYPGFNLTLAKKLKKMGVKVIYYITPQVWAWGKSRINLIKKYVDKALVIFKFEEDLFRKHGVDATFVGHPLLDREATTGLNKKSLALDEGKLLIALLPGSRHSEVKNMLPAMLAAAKLIQQKKDVQFILLKSSSVDEAVYRNILEKTDIRIAEIKDNTYGCLELADFVFTSSGTATLECAIMERPMLIIYKTSFLTALLFRMFAKTRFIGLVNIIAKRQIAPEVLQYDTTPKRLANEILAIISSKEKTAEQTSALRWVKHSLGTQGASLRAARVIKDFITQQL